MTGTPHSHATVAADSPRQSFIREGAPPPEQPSGVNARSLRAHIEALDGVPVPVYAVVSDDIAAPESPRRDISNTVEARGLVLAATAALTPPALDDLATPSYRGTVITQQRLRGAGGSQSESKRLVRQWLATGRRSQQATCFNYLEGMYRTWGIPMFPIRPEVLAVVLTKVDSTLIYSAAKLARSVMSWAKVKTAQLWRGEIKRKYHHLDDTQLQRKISKDFGKNRYYAALLATLDLDRDARKTCANPPTSA